MRPHAANALELNIEEAHGALTVHPRTIYLTNTRRLVWGQRADSYDKTFEVGTFDRRVSLADFRDAVFYAWDTRR